MLNRAPYNTEVPEFSPARDAPINSYIVRKYPCQEQVAGKTNHFRSLTWKIQQPDASLVWQSVKIIMPMTIQCVNDSGVIADMNVYHRRPTCNLALSQSPMNAFEQTTLSINGRIFSEVNSFRDILDACYRGIGAQAYGDNHSLKPIVQRNIFNGQLPANNQLPLFKPDGTNTGHYVQTTDLEERVVDSAFTLLEHNGPFIERARIFQDQLNFDGKTWSGEISHLLELGPFQARARKGNTAVPYIKDFHLRLNFQNNPSHFDVKNPAHSKYGGYQELGGRTMAPKLLEFATMPNFLHHGEAVLSHTGWPCDFSFMYTEKPYLEVTYTKHESGMRPFYNLRCFEHQYEQSPRFTLDAPLASMESPTSLQRVTTRLLSLPTKVYVWADLADEYKHSFISGGVRRSCLLDNMHLRVNQRPDVMFNPSQEECYEMFRRHTNSSLEYGSWLKSPIYCFDMVDIGQSDMYSNDARVTWMEWDAEASLTQLQMTENRKQKEVSILGAHCYGSIADLSPNFWDASWASSSPAQFTIDCLWDANKIPLVSHDSVDLAFTLSYHNQGDATGAHILAYSDFAKLPGTDMHFADTADPNAMELITAADVQLDTVAVATMSLQGYMWAEVCIKTHNTTGASPVSIPKYTMKNMWYVPESYRFVPDQKGVEPMWNTTDKISWTYAASTDTPTFTWDHTKGEPVIISGVFQDNPKATYLNGKRFGAVGPASAPITAKQVPGRFAYEIDADGIRNLASDTNYQRGGAKLDNNHGYMRLTDPTNWAWVCFIFRSAHPTPGPGAGGNASNKWAQWRSDVVKPGDGTGTNVPNYWNRQDANTYTDWGNGYQQVNVAGKGAFGRTDQQVFQNRPTRIGLDQTFGANLGKDMTTAADQQALEQYRMKVLYEYGNCQYQFSADGSPTKVLPNLVPVQ